MAVSAIDRKFALRTPAKQFGKEEIIPAVVAAPVADIIAAEMGVGADEAQDLANTAPNEGSDQAKAFAEADLQAAINDQAAEIADGGVMFNDAGGQVLLAQAGAADFGAAIAEEMSGGLAGGAAAGLGGAEIGLLALGGIALSGGGGAGGPSRDLSTITYETALEFADPSTTRAIYDLPPQNDKGDEDDRDTGSPDFISPAGVYSDEDGTPVLLYLSSAIESESDDIYIDIGGDDYSPFNEGSGLYNGQSAGASLKDLGEKDGPEFLIAYGDFYGDNGSNDVMILWVNSGIIGEGEDLALGGWVIELDSDTQYIRVENAVYELSWRDDGSIEGMIFIGLDAEPAQLNIA